MDSSLVMGLILTLTWFLDIPILIRASLSCVPNITEPFYFQSTVSRWFSDRKSLLSLSMPPISASSWWFQHFLNRIYWFGWSFVISVVVSWWLLCIPLILVSWVCYYCFFDTSVVDPSPSTLSSQLLAYHLQQSRLGYCVQAGWVSCWYWLVLVSSWNWWVLMSLISVLSCYHQALLVTLSHHQASLVDLGSRFLCHHSSLVALKALKVLSIILVISILVVYMFQGRLIWYISSSLRGSIGDIMCGPWFPKLL